MDGINKNSDTVFSNSPPPKRARRGKLPTGFIMGKEVTVYNESSPHCLNLPSATYAGQSIELQEKSPFFQSTSDETACAFSRPVSLYSERDSRLLSDVLRVLGVDKKYMPDRVLAKKSDTFSLALELSLGELEEETISSVTSLVLQKNFDLKSYSESTIFSPDDQDGYKNYLNNDPKHDYVFFHKLKVSDDSEEESIHDFVIVRGAEKFHLLQSVSGAFTLEQWITGDSSMINNQAKEFKEDCDLSLFQCEKKSSPSSAKKMQRIYKEFEKIKSSFGRVIKTSNNKACSKSIFGQKFVPTLFSALKNSDDRPYFRMFSSSRRYLGVKKEDKITLEVYRGKI
ncbi:hypothetical protein [Endozoicomonas sp. 2B-B]